MLNSVSFSGMSPLHQLVNAFSNEHHDLYKDLCNKALEKISLYKKKGKASITKNIINDNSIHLLDEELMDTMGSLELQENEMKKGISTGKLHYNKIVDGIFRVLNSLKMASADFDLTIDKPESFKILEREEEKNENQYKMDEEEIGDIKPLITKGIFSNNDKRNVNNQFGGIFKKQAVAICISNTQKNSENNTSEDKIPAITGSSLLHLCTTHPNERLIEYL